MKFWLCLILALTLISTNLASAEDTNLDPWPIVQRCLPAPIVPDKNWSYDGEILMSGWAGLHAIRATSTTPYVVYWGKGILSPNGEWVLSQELDTMTIQLGGGGPLGIFDNHYGDITVQNFKTGEKIKFDWQAFTEIDSGPYPYGTANPLWLDNNHFVSIYGDYRKTKEGNLETGKVIDRPDIDLEDHEYSISPDQTPAISYGQLYDLSKQIVIKQNVASQDLNWTAWANDSSNFIDVVRDKNDDKILSVFDRDGVLLATPLISRWINLGKLSPNNQYFSFAAYRSDNDHNHQYVLDLDKKLIYDLCVGELQGLVWSPDGTQFATILGQGQKPIVVVDMNDWQPYIVGYHTGSVLFWRSLT